MNSFPPLIAGEPPLLVPVAEAAALVPEAPPAVPVGVPALLDAERVVAPVAEAVELPVTTGPVMERVAVVETPVTVAFEGKDWLTMGGVTPGPLTEVMVVVITVPEVEAPVGLGVGAAPVGSERVEKAVAPPPEQGMVSMNAGEHWPPWL